MKIRNQLKILSYVIVSLPILFSVTLFINHYLNSPERALLTGSKEIRKIEEQSEKFTKQEWKELSKTMKLLPANVQAVLVDQDNVVLYSTIEEISLGSSVSKAYIWNLMESTTEEFFYQFTAPKIGNRSVILITRILRNQEKSKNPKKNMFPYLMGLLIVIVVISIVIIYLLAKDIYKSIELVENKTQDLADGQLNSPITTSKRDNEITITLNGLEKMRLSLLDAQNKKNLFIMSISHDLKTPVAVIKGYTEAIKDGFITDEKELDTAYELIQTKSTQLENMINSLISYTKMNDICLKEKLQKHPIDRIINTFGKEAVITGEIYKRKVITDINLSNDILVPLDEQLVTRLFENIYNNAIRYTNEGDIIKIQAYEDYESIIVKISDTGIGIEKENLENIFELFYRETSSRREEGMGIGLAVVKNIIDIHGWNISVTSEKGKGSCFTIIIQTTE